jgi:hypothetical protein
MVINFRFLLGAALLFNLVLPVFSFKPSGGVLVLDGDDDYAILPLVEHGYLFPKHTGEFTVEMWFYPKAGPKRDKERNVILSQQVVFGLTVGNKNCELNESQLCFYTVVSLEGEVRGSAMLDVPVERNQWNYVAIIYKDSILGFAYNNRILRTRKFDLMNLVAANLDKALRPKDFFVGGYDEELQVRNRGQLVFSATPFYGDIDVIRFSNIARYDLPAKPSIGPFDPPHRFFSDEHTLALWNFNEPAGADRFRDASGNGKTLIGMNGATTSGALAVSPNSASLTTTWGRIKSEPR